MTEAITDLNSLVKSEEYGKLIPDFVKILPLASKVSIVNFDHGEFIQNEYMQSKKLEDRIKDFKSNIGLVLCGRAEIFEVSALRTHRILAFRPVRILEAKELVGEFRLLDGYHWPDEVLDSRPSSDWMVVAGNPCSIPLGVHNGEDPELISYSEASERRRSKKRKANTGIGNKIEEVESEIKERNAGTFNSYYDLRDEYLNSTLLLDIYHEQFAELRKVLIGESDHKDKKEAKIKSTPEDSLLNEIKTKSNEAYAKAQTTAQEKAKLNGKSNAQTNARRIDSDLLTFNQCLDEKYTVIDKKHISSSGVTIAYIEIDSSILSTEMKHAFFSGLNHQGWRRARTYRYSLNSYNWRKYSLYSTIVDGRYIVAAGFDRAPVSLSKVFADVIWDALNRPLRGEPCFRKRLSADNFEYLVASCQFSEEFYYPIDFNNYVANCHGLSLSLSARADFVKVLTSPRSYDVAGLINQCVLDFEKMYMNNGIDYPFTVELHLMHCNVSAEYSSLSTNWTFSFLKFTPKSSSKAK